MKAVAFDGIVRELGDVSTRRSMFRLLGGAAAMGAGLVLGGESLAKGKGQGKSHGKARADGHGKGRDQGQTRSQEKAKDRGNVTAQKKKGSVTICYQKQTLTVKKKGYSKKYPGATFGVCPPPPPTGCSGTGQGSCATGQTCVNGQCQTATTTTTPAPKPQPQPQPEPQPEPEPACTRWIISGGPNQYDPILADDDIYIFNLSRGGQGILNDENKVASALPPTAPFDANVGETLNIVGYDAGGCRSLGPLWLHCLATGQKRQIFTGFNQGSCTNGAGTFLNQPVTVSL